MNLFCSDKHVKNSRSSSTENKEFGNQYSKLAINRIFFEKDPYSQ